MKFQYIGDREFIEYYGISFPHGVYVDVDPKQVAYTVKLKGQKTDVLVVAKLDGHRDFEKAKPGRPKNGNDSAS